MPFSSRPYYRFPVHCAVSYNAGPVQGQGTVWNLSWTGWRLSGDLPMRPGKTLSLTVTLPCAPLAAQELEESCGVSQAQQGGPTMSGDEKAISGTKEEKERDGYAARRAQSVRKRPVEAASAS
jgi:hypothetical protein